MFKNLKQKWKVNGLQLALIICTFAIGGSLTGFTAKKIMNRLAIEHDWLWTIIYILLITIIWPLAVIVISIFFGQFHFFSGYVRRLGEKIGIVKSPESRSASSIEYPVSGIQLPESKTHIAIFASGAGSNAQNIIDHFKNSASIKIDLVICNKPAAGVLEIARKENIRSIIIEKER